MVSGYLNKEIRDRSVIARDLVSSAHAGWDKASVIADSLDVVFAVLVYDLETAELSFDYSSAHCWAMTGYWARELTRKNIEVLLDCEQQSETVSDLIDELKDTGHADAYVVCRRKNGTQFGCHILAHRAERTSSNKQISYHTFLSECDIASCH